MPDLAVIPEAEHERLDRLERAMLGAAGAGLTAPVELPVEHRHFPGLYAREIFMPAGTLLTSKIHNTEHPYVVLTGCVSVFIPGVGVERIEAPFVGTTRPGTRRVLYIHEDCRWITFHPNPENLSVADLEERIIERREVNGETAYELYAAMLDEMTKELPGQADFGGAP